jgi:hypothetical protein
MRRMNRGQRVVIVIGLGVAMYSLGGWITTRGTGTPYGWVGYAPLQTYNTPNILGGLHPWVRLVIWIALVVVWVFTSMLLLRSPAPPQGDASE